MWPFVTRMLGYTGSATTSPCWARSFSWRPTCEFLSHNKGFVGDDIQDTGHASFALLRYRKFNAMKVLTDFAGQNWLITPAARAVGEPRPASIHDQKWLLVLSGVVLANLKGYYSGEWHHETVLFT